MLQTMRMYDDRSRMDPPFLPQRPISRARPPSSRMPVARCFDHSTIWSTRGEAEEQLSSAVKSEVEESLKIKAGIVVKHSRIWCRTSSASSSWQFGVVHSVLENGAFLCSISDELVEVEPKEIHPANPDILEGVDDLTKLSFLNEPSVVHNLKNRFDRDIIYTSAGPVLIAINPFKKMPLYSLERVHMYRQGSKDLEPHVFAITDKACKALFRDGISQSVIISGESGAGKTETAKIAMQYIATFGGGRGVEDEILETNPLLEAFGNAKTLRNDNSSRFGKLIDIYFDESGTICGAKIQTYLLEKSRVVHQAHGERSYHVFYQLCSGADQGLREHLNLKAASEYCYLNRSGCLKIEFIDDAKQFLTLVNAMDRVRISKEDQLRLFEMLAAVLWLGNISFFIVNNDNHLMIEDNEAARSVAALLGCQIDDLNTSLCTRKINARGEVIVQRLTVAQAMDSRDALAKAIYASLFDWLVEKINESLEAGRSCETKFISILDIYGFESFESNSFEQLCINYANERLQQFFNHHLFKLEQEEYTSEAIDWTKIDFVDNQECLDLIEKKPLGLITLLDEECSFPKATEASLAMKLNEHLKANACFKAERGAGFTIQHYAGEVTYGTAGFLEKNRDLLHSDLLQLLGSCQHQLAQAFSTKMGNLGKLNGVELQRRSVATKFKNQLLNLMERLENTSPHFIRCVKPNRKQLPSVFDVDLILQQLHCCGVLEVVRISRSGYPTRYPFQQFAERYAFLFHELKAEEDDYLNISLLILQKFSISADAFQVGRTKLFFRPGQIGILEHLRTRTLKSIVYVQARLRATKARSDYKYLRKVAIYLQSLVRGRQDRRSYEYLKLAYTASLQIQRISKGFLARKHYKALRKKWFASIVIQKHARGLISRTRFRQQRLIQRGAITIQKFYRGSVHARRWSGYWKRRVSATILLQKHFRSTLAKMRYSKSRRRIVLIQAAVRGWLCRKKLGECQVSEDDGEYVNISAVDLDMEIECKNASAKLAEDTSASVYQLQQRLLETEKNLCRKEDENAELAMKLRLYERRWNEYEDKMNKMEDLWQNQMVSLQQSLEAAKKSLATTAVDTKPSDMFEVQSNASRHRAARPILPSSEEADSDDNASMGIKTPESTASFNKESHTVVEHLAKEFEHRSHVFNDDIEFIVEVKSGQIEADLDPEIELRKLKQRFDAWKKDFKLQMKETKGLLQKLETSDRNKKKWWGKKTNV